MVSPPLLEEFVAKATAAGAEIQKCPGPEEALGFLLCFSRDEEIQRLAVAPDAEGMIPESARLPIFRPKRREDYLKPDAALVRADYGIAGTGTLVHLDRNEEEKIAWTLPPVCLCLLETRFVVPDVEELADVFSRHLAEKNLAAPQVSLVTGPSRTADIECQLSLGVHGPRRLIVLLVESIGDLLHEKD